MLQGNYVSVGVAVWRMLTLLSWLQTEATCCGPTQEAPLKSNLDMESLVKILGKIT